MRLIFQGAKKAWAVEFTFAQVAVREAREIADDGDDELEEETLRYDPRSTTNAHLERRSDLEDMYGRTPFGFGK